MAEYNVRDVNKGIFGDYGTFNDYSINVTNNYNIRINLEDRAKNGKTYEYTMFCLHEYKNNKIKEQDVIRVTCVNVHSENMFISDHIQMAFPKRLYDEISYNYSVMKVKAKAYKYQRTNGTYDYGLLVTKIESAVNRLGYYQGKYGSKSPLKLNNDQKELFSYLYINNISENCLSEIISKQISYLEGIIANDNQVYSGFLFDMLATYYFANDYKHELETKSLYLCNLDRKVLIELLQLFSKLIYKINNGEIFMWRHVLQETNECCNVFQNINKNICIRNESKGISVQEFADKIKSKETRKIFNKIKIRNDDFEYQYPKNINKFKEQLDEYTIWYLFNQNYFDIKMYAETWREDLGII